ncbi:phosphotransferase family protein [Mesomycoplasma neurolyticum]|uniref:Uncharacterized protein n=1 Tax=Mesomycoplasma neurolyticum TaxID=2120 RepID=A0A449A5P6_9BACT|nr:hypothetical protein [Mesomycoplasma neurolyticum]VEU59575.1 Uncharacterised protein [Mesomycoplasma neurolyticum]
MNIKSIKELLPKKIYEKLSDIQLFYEGFHNKTYLANYGDEKVQIRVAINKIAQHKDEIEYIKNDYDYIYFTDEILVKKWYEGHILNEKNLTKKDCYVILDKMKKVWENKGNYTKMNWFYYTIDDVKYKKIVEKYKDDFNDTIHGDIRAKNIIHTYNNDFILIDFEWVRKGSKYFDICSFLKFSKLSKQEVIDYLKLDKEKLEDYIYITNLFNKNAYYQVYDKLKDFYIGEIKNKK